MSLVNVNGTLSSAVAASGGTFTISYPTGYSAGSFQQSVGHSLVINGNVVALGTGFIVSFGASATAASNVITVTNKGTTAWPQGASFYASFETIGDVNFTASNGLQPFTTAETKLLEINLGAPAAANSTALAASQSISANGSAALATYTFDAPRTVVAAWTTSAKITVTGKDVYGATVTESMASAGTSFTGKKAFNSVSSITSDTAITGFTAGTGAILGLPVFLPSTANIIKEIDNNAAATAGTTVAGLALASGPSTSTTADVRGTYSPSNAPDSTHSYTLIVALADPGYKGLPQA
jgi:hypothetical protein